MAKNKIHGAPTMVQEPQAEKEQVVVQEPVVEPKKEETVKKQPKEVVDNGSVAKAADVKSKSQPVSDIKEVEDIKSVLEDRSLSIQQKLDKIATANTPITRFAHIMLEYQNKMGKKAVTPAPATIAANNYNLYTRLIKICKTEDYQEFKIYFDVVNYIFNEFKDDAYSDHLLVRGDLDWKWGEKSYQTYQNLVTLICTLCDRKTRQAKMVSISLNKVLDLDRTTFTETMVNNIRKYYAE